MRRIRFAIALSLGVIAAPVAADDLNFAMGKALFDRVWTPAPTSTDATDGLGPLFNARFCAACHPAGGRGSFQEDEAGNVSGPGLVGRIGSASGQGDPVYGRQLQPMAVQAVQAEGVLKRLPNGSIAAHGITMGGLHQDSRISGRLAPSLMGAGLLAQVPEEAILVWADPQDANGDGISGRANYVLDADGKRQLGRFNWKASQPSILSQSAAALHLDLGLSNPLHRDPYGDCTGAQVACRAAPHGASPRFGNLEVDETMLALIVAYVEGLPPPVSADLKGAQVFAQIGCAACHRPTLPTKDGATIMPYTDLLLHDMGDGLADGIAEAEAAGNEWRTAPLWGLGAATRYLHDGRATSLSEAIAYHGGEAQGAAQAFAGLPPDQQQDLLEFLGGL